MGQALYRKYRSKTLEDIVGQDHITKTLQRAVKTNRISHAYLFTGPRGVGKTSIARILAHDINGLDYRNDQSPVDIIEIDAASNRRIDEIRDLREKVYIAPTSAKYKVYIIDEVHMLTKEAFNALLKTLEEPPAHVVFILATTDAHKLPATIVSRTQRFQFRPIATDKVCTHLKMIAKQESIKINDQALQLIAEHGQGSFRDSIGLLDQAANYEQPITAETINSLLGTPAASSIAELISHLSVGDSKSLAQIINGMFEQGYSAPVIASQMAKVLRQQLIDGTDQLPHNELLSLLGDLIDVPASPDPERFLELSLFKALPRYDSGAKQHPGKPSPTTTGVVPVPDTPKVSTHSISEPDRKPLTKDKTKTGPISNKPKTGALFDETKWPAVLNLLKSKHNTLYGIIRMAQLDNSAPGIIRLQFAFAFHQKRVNEAKNRDILLSAIEQLTHQSFSLDCVVNTSLLTKTATDSNEVDLSAIANVFGLGETAED